MLPESPRKHRRLAKMVTIAAWSYLVAVLAAWMLLGWFGDRWWFASVLLYGPRWPYALPWMVLAPIAVLTRPRLLWPLAVSAIVLLGPIMGLCLPWSRLVARNGPIVRVLSCNIDGESVDTDRLAALVDEAQPAVVALQECPEDIPLHWPKGWHILHAGQLLVASPYPLRNVETSLSRHPPGPWPPVDGLRCIVETPQGPVGFCCVHLLTPRAGLSEVLDRKTIVSPARNAGLENETVERTLESEELLQWIEDWPGTWIVAGDFNMPTDSAIYRATWAKHVDAFSSSGFGFGYTKWTPVKGWQYGLRIDHVLAGPGLKPRRCWVGPDVGSDHLPLLADIVLPPAE
jgi:vancomycin resistance protein VanJ